MRYQAALRPDICCFLDFKPLSQFPIPSGLPKSSNKTPDRGKTVTKPHQLTFSVSKPGRASFAFRFNFCSASRFICSFICEYFLNTLASPCRSNWVTYSSATPPALKRVAYVDRRSQIRKYGTLARRNVACQTVLSVF